ncbi:MAG TPA: pyridoxamine 5'-phosphate oxidase family protein [Stellaceae bacterium]
MAIPAQSETDRQDEIERMLAAARRVIEALPFFWVVTSAADGGANARIVNAQPGRAGEDFWTRWFLTPPNGRKATEIRRAGRATLAYQHPSGEGFVTLSGPAELIEDPAEVNSRFRGSRFDDPKGLVAGGLVAVRVIADHLELHIRGITAEPWGRGRHSLDRNPDGSWTLHPPHYDAPIAR